MFNVCRNIGASLRGTKQSRIATRILRIERIISLLFDEFTFHSLVYIVFFNRRVRRAFRKERREVTTSLLVCVSIKINKFISHEEVF